MLLRGEIPQVRPEQVLLRIRYEDATAQPLVPVIEKRRQPRDKLELDGLPGPGRRPRPARVTSTPSRSTFDPGTRATPPA